MPTPLVTMREALDDPNLLGTVMPGASWIGWRALLIAAMGEELADDERAIFSILTGRDREPLERVDEFWAVVGRRGGKTRASAVAAVYLGALVDYSDVLAVGERGLLPFMAASQRQAEVAFGYAVGIMRAVPLLSRTILNETADTLTLKTGVDLVIRAASNRTSRGPTYVAAIGDEAAFWRNEDSANPDAEILNAVRPGLATTNGPLIVISSPYARRGEVYATWRKHYGERGDPLILVAQAASRVLNPTLPQRVVDRAMERDEASAKAEYLAQFRSDVEACLPAEAIEAVTPLGVSERGRLHGVHYYGFVDPSGGSADSFTMAVGHMEGGRTSGKVILDLVREVRPPFSPEIVVGEFVADLKRYGITKVEGDRYAGEWVREPFRKLGVTYDASAKPKSDLYRDLIPRVNSREVDLLDIPRLKMQLVGLERRTSRGGRDSIDHAPGGHDDVANAVAGCIVQIFDREFKAQYSGAGFGKYEAGINSSRSYNGRRSVLAPGSSL